MHTWMCLVLVVLLGCGSKKDKEPAGAGTGTGTGTGSAPAVVADGSVEIFVDDRSVAKVAPADLDAWPRLDSLVPEEARRLGTWDAVAFAGTVDSKLEKPSQNHPDKVPVLFRGKDGKPAFGMFDAVELAKKGEPAFRADAIRQVRITVSKMQRGGDHQGSTGESVDPTKLVVKITTPDGEKQITGPEILKLPREPQPGNEDTKGWRVTQFLEAAGVTKWSAITLVDANGTTIPYTSKELDPATTVPFIKLNKQGSLRFRMYTKQGTGWQSGADLRSLVAIQVK